MASNTAVTTFIGEGTAIQNFTGPADLTFVLAPLFETPIADVPGFLGNPNFALTAAAVAAVLTFRRVRNITHSE